MPYPEEYYKMFDAGEYSSSSSAECLMSCNLNNNTSSSSCGISKRKKSKNKRRFSDDQIKSLETIFDTETKLEPKKKLQLARELGLQPRQVAVWFQNKRARWKSKQLERDYSLLQSSYDSLASQFVSLKKERQTLLEQLQKLSELKGKSDEKESAECHRSYEDSGGPGRNIDGDADGADNNMIKNNRAASTCAGGDQLINAKKVGVFLDMLSDDDDESSRNPAADDSCAYLGLEEEAAAQLPLNIASSPAHTCNLTQAEEWGTLEVESYATLLDQPCINGYKWWDFLL